MDDNQKLQLKQYFKNVYGIKYQQYIQSIEKSKDKTIDATEYKTFLYQTVEKDIIPLAHALLNRVITFQEYWGIMLTIVGYDLLVQSHLAEYKKEENDEPNT